MHHSTNSDGLIAPKGASVVHEGDIAYTLIEKLVSLKYSHHPDIHDRSSLEDNFKEKVEDLNIMCTTDTEYARLLDENAPSYADINQHIAMVCFDKGKLWSKFNDYFALGKITESFLCFNEHMHQGRDKTQWNLGDRVHGAGLHSKRNLGTCMSSLYVPITARILKSKRP